MRTIEVSDADIIAVAAAGVAAGAAPILGWLKIAELVIDDDYQRDLKPDNWRRIRKIADRFRWSRFSPVFVSPIEGGRYAVIDGQHRTHAAAICGFAEVPCQIVQMTREEQAASFAAVNGMVTKVTGYQILKAAIVAGEGWAIRAAKICEDGGCRLMTYPGSTGFKKPGEIYPIALIRKLDIGPRKRAIFDGPPGVGKTTLAHHLSARLGLPMLAVRPERLISKYLGQTAEQIGKLFDAAAVGLDPERDGDKRTPIVLFLDEFDAIGQKRRASTDSGAEDERNAYVNTLLQRLEQHKGFVIAATNFGGHIDPAIWRRFDMHITLELPGQFEREQIIKRYLAPFALPKTALTLLAEGMDSAAPALMRQFCEHLKRQLIIGPKLGHDMGKTAVFERLVATIQPHPELGKPPMWATADSDRARDRAISSIPWPLPKIGDGPPETDATGGGMTDNRKIVSLAGRRA